MKVASLWGVAVILLALVAGRARAQFDSNATMTVHCGAVSAECTMTITRIFNYTDTSTYTVGAAMSGGVDYSGRFAPSITLGSFNQYLNISIDSVHKTLLLNFHKSEIVETNESSGEDDIDVTFDSLSYKITQSGGLRAEGFFSASDQFGAFQVVTLPHGNGGGSCNSEEQVTDSVFIEITPESSSIVNSLTEPNMKIGLTASIVGDGVEIFNFFPSPFKRELNVFNLLGANQIQRSIASGVNSLLCSIEALPPGCYFARLGDQVAKFVVPPR